MAPTSGPTRPTENAKYAGGVRSFHARREGTGAPLAARRPSRPSGAIAEGRALDRAPRRAPAPSGRGGAAGPRSRRTGPRTGPDPAPTPPARPPPAALSERESLAFLAAAGMAVTAGDRAVVDAAKRPSTAARAIAGPVALKVDADGLAHKSDLGGVALGLPATTRSEAAAAARSSAGQHRPGRPRARSSSRWPAASNYRRAAPGPPVRAGRRRRARRHLHRGPRRRGDRLAPVGHATALAMLDELRGRRLLDGVRGGRPSIGDAVADADRGAGAPRRASDRTSSRWTSTP